VSTVPTEPAAVFGVFAIGRDMRAIISPVAAASGAMYDPQLRVSARNQRRQEVDDGYGSS
jgi:hypothetical protein